MNVREEDARRHAIDAVRAKRMEADQAFSDVIGCRNDLTEARKRVAAASTHGRTPPQRFVDHVAGLMARLAEATAYAMQVCPDRLREHDRGLADAAGAQRAQEDAAEAARLVETQKAHEATRLKAEERIRLRVAQRASEAIFMAEVRATMG